MPTHGARQHEMLAAHLPSLLGASRLQCLLVVAEPASPNQQIDVIAHPLRSFPKRHLRRWTYPVSLVFPEFPRHTPHRSPLRTSSAAMAAHSSTISIAALTASFRVPLDPSNTRALSCNRKTKASNKTVDGIANGAGFAHSGHVPTADSPPYVRPHFLQLAIVKPSLSRWTAYGSTPG